MSPRVPMSGFPRRPAVVAMAGLSLVATACAVPRVPPAGPGVVAKGPPPPVEPTGKTRTYEFTVTEGDYALKMMDGKATGTVHGFLTDGQFLLPTIVVDVGDAVDVTVHNHTAQTIGLHPHGVHYDLANDGIQQVVPPGETHTYHWEATNGPGTFLYHSHQMDGGMIEAQAEQGILGFLVIRDPAEEAAWHTDHMVNYLLMNTYLPTTSIEDAPMDGMEMEHHEADPHEMDMPDEPHNHTMVVQEVRDGVTRTIDSLVSAAHTGENIRVNIAAFGDDFHTFHTHGYAWRDPWTGALVDTKTLGPAETSYFHLTLGNPGKWMVHCHVDDHMAMMTTWLDVQ